MLKKLNKEIKKPEYKEYFTRYIKHNKNRFKIINFKHRKDISDLRLTIDEEIDLEVIEKFTNTLSIKKFFNK